MKINKIYLAFCIVAIALFFVGRCSAPSPVAIDSTRVVDSLNRSLLVTTELKRFHEERAATFRKQAEAKQKSKIILRTIYQQAKANNHALPPAVQDSVVNAIGNAAVLDMRAELQWLRAVSEIDSISYTFLQKSAEEMDKALQHCTAGAATQELVITQQKKEIRKQKFLKKVFVGATVFVTTVLIVKQ